MRALKRLERYDRKVGGDSDCCDCIRSSAQEHCETVARDTNYKSASLRRAVVDEEGTEEEEKESDVNKGPEQSRAETVRQMSANTRVTLSHVINASLFLFYI
jgi:hypothetical protein